MNKKITLQDIVELLVQRQDITKKDAEVFVKAMFDLIEELLEREKCVKVKGLGLFKLIRVESRESVNINTGERFEIQGHSKISFIPETAVRDLINKPFAYFDAVPLNDGAVLTDTLESEDITLDEPEQQPEDAVDCQASGGEILSENNAKERTVDIIEEKEQEPKVRKSWYIILVSLLVCAFIGYQLYRTDNVEESVINPVKPQVMSSEKVIQPDKSELSDKDTCLLDSIQSPPLEKEEITKEDLTKKQHATDEEKQSAVLSLSPEADYEIAGILRNHTICSGETLRKISLKYYGTKELSSYIARYNQDVIKNPDNVPVGTIIKIPKLKQK